jgi:large subunit ribosomal protein L31
LTPEGSFGDPRRLTREATAGRDFHSGRSASPHQRGTGRRETAMKEGIHPTYRDVVFQDPGANFAILTKSTIDVKGRETMKWEDGNEYPVIRVEISSASHPFYTGKQKIMDTAGRVEKFRQRYSRTPRAAAK